MIPTGFAATGRTSNAPSNMPGHRKIPTAGIPNETGILSGRQHQTLDMELFGPNSWLGTMYVAALLGVSEMAAALGETALAEKTTRMGKAGAAYIDCRAFQRTLVHPEDRSFRQGVC